MCLSSIVSLANYFEVGKHLTLVDCLSHWHCFVTLSSTAFGKQSIINLKLIDSYKVLTMWNICFMSKNASASTRVFLNWDLINDKPPLNKALFNFSFSLSCVKKASEILTAFGNSVSLQYSRVVNLLCSFSIIWQCKHRYIVDLSFLLHF